MKPSGIASRRVIIVDTGPLVAAIDANDSHHRWARATLPRLSAELFTCEAIITEACHLLDNQPAALNALQQFLARMEVIPLHRDDIEAAFGLMKQFSPQMDFADACLVRLAARLEDVVVLTTDTRDFSTYRVPFASPEGLFTRW